jgi:hypothetical protein
MVSALPTPPGGNPNYLELTKRVLKEVSAARRHNGWNDIERLLEAEPGKTQVLIHQLVRLNGQGRHFQVYYSRVLDHYIEREGQLCIELEGRGNSVFVPYSTITSCLIEGVQIAPPPPIEPARAEWVSPTPQLRDERSLFQKARDYINHYTGW